MTIEEAISVFESWAKCNYKPTHDAAVLAITALRAQQKTERFRAKAIARSNEFLEYGKRDDDSCLCCLAGAIHGVVRMLDKEVELTMDDLDRYLRKQLQDPEFAREYRRLGTNANRIRAMSNEELAEWLSYYAHDGYINPPEGWYAWLQQPVEIREDDSDG